MRNTVAAFLTLLCLTVPALVSSGCGSNGNGPARVTLRARAPERGNWAPRTIRLERGRPVTLVIRNVDIATHSFYAPALGLNTGAILPGESKEVTFTPEAAGEYLFLCAIWCSDYHMYERGTIVVE